LRHIELVVAVGRNLVFAGLDDKNAVLTHQSADTAVTDVQTDFFQRCGHP